MRGGGAGRAHRTLRAGAFAALLGGVLAAPTAATAWPVFAAPTTHLSGGTAASVSIGDVTGDGRADVVLSTDTAFFDPAHAWKLVVFRQQADGSLAPPMRLATHGGPEPGRDGQTQQMGVATGDIDGDGKTDAALAVAGGVDVFLQRDGELEPPTLVPTSASARQVEIADLDHNGLADLAVHVRGGIDVLWNEGGGAFTRTTIFAGDLGAPPPSALWGEIEAGDVTGDGRIDVVAFGARSVRVFAQGPGRTFAESPYVTDPPDEWGYALALGDVTGDGRGDVLAAAQSLQVFRQSPTGDLLPPVVRPGVGGTAVETGDVDSDGLMDVVTSSGSFTLLRQTPGGDLAPPCRYPVPAMMWSPKGLAVGDANGDGRLDVVVATDGGVAVSRQQPPGTTTPSSFGTFSGVERFVIAGETLTLTGRLTFVNGGCLAGQRVRIVHVAANGAETVVGEAPLDADGRFSFDHAPAQTGPTTYRAVWPGNESSQPATSESFNLAVGKHGTALALAASAQKVRYNAPVTLTATLTGAPAGSVVSLYETAGGATRLVASGAVDSAGIFTTVVSAKRTATYEAEFAETAKHWGSRSERKLVLVDAILEARMVGGRRASGGSTVYRYRQACPDRGRDCPRVAATVRPAHPGMPVQITLQVRTPTGWTFVLQRRIRMTQAGTVGLTLEYADANVTRFPARVKARFPGDPDHGGAESRWMRFRIVR